MSKLEVKMAHQNGGSDGHEARIQNNESDISELKAAHAETSTTLKYLSHQLTDATVRIAEKIDMCVSTLTEKIKDKQIQLDAVSNRVNEHGQFIDKAITAQKTRDKRWSALRTVIAAVLTAGTGAVIKELIMLFMKH